MTELYWKKRDIGIDGVEIDGMGGAMPYQAEGRIDGMPFYFRYRGGVATLRIGKTEDGPTGPLDDCHSYSIVYGDAYEGRLEDDEFKMVFGVLLARHRGGEKQVFVDAIQLWRLLYLDESHPDWMVARGYLSHALKDYSPKEEKSDRSGS